EGTGPRAWAQRPRMGAVIDRYIKERQLVDRPATIQSVGLALTLFVRWLIGAHPEIESFASVTREELLEFAEYLNGTVGLTSKRPYSLSAKIGVLSSLNVFFRRISEWSHWEGDREGDGATKGERKH